MTPPRRKRRSQQAVRRTVLLVTNGRVTEYAYLSQPADVWAMAGFQPK